MRSAVQPFLRWSGPPTRMEPPPGHIIKSKCPRPICPKSSRLQAQTTRHGRGDLALLPGRHRKVPQSACAKSRGRTPIRGSKQQSDRHQLRCRPCQWCGGQACTIKTLDSPQRGMSTQSREYRPDHPRMVMQTRRLQHKILQ